MTKHLVSLCVILLALVLSTNIYSQTWTTQTSGVTTSLNCVSTVDANIGWIGGAGGVILKTVNGGTTWTNVANATVGANDVNAIFALSASVCFVSTAPSATYVFKTTDGGTTWTQVFTQAGGFIDDIKFKDANTGFMYGDPVGSRWSLWKTSNAGLTWDSTGLYLPQAASEAGWNNAMQLTGNTIWFGTNNTKVYKSTNFGATGSWTAGTTTGTANSYSVAFNGNTGFTGMTAAAKSTDGGSTYAAVTLPGTGTCYSFNTVAGTNRFWYNRANIIYGSTDNGTNFTTQYTGTSGAVYQAMSIILTGSTIRGWSVSNTGLIAMYSENYAPVPSGTWTEQTSGITSVLYSVSAVNDNVAWVCGAGGKVLRTTNKGQAWVNVSGTIP
ncbi:MAG: YCF48-related protein, partial [Ignavibacteria bacterium]|nr:YCF48-related protein [Ignavibacteria bacterium]